MFRPLTCIALVAVVVAGCTSSPGAAPTRAVPTATGLDGIQAFPGLSHAHVTTPVTFLQRPPVGGPHFPPQAFGVLGWQRCAVYDEPVVDTFAVHSMEHGAVWLTYRPGTPAAGIAALRVLADLRPDYVLVSPYPGQPRAFTASTWGLQLSVDNVDDPRLVMFVRRYAGGAQGSEPGADCVHGSTLQQARAAVAAAARH